MGGAERSQSELCLVGDAPSMQASGQDIARARFGASGYGDSATEARMIAEAPATFWQDVIARVAQIIADRSMGLQPPKVVPFREPPPRKEERPDA